MEVQLSVPRKITWIEALVGLSGLAICGLLIWSQFQNIQAQHRDSSRKVAINSLRANLEEVIYPSQGGYPETLDPKAFIATDIATLADQQGVLINAPGSEFRYEPSGCTKGICKHYILRAELEKEAPYTQKSAH